jgi:ABC-type sulfate/molybdate transport systems ATPase subunit
VFSQYWIVNRTGLPILFRPVESADSSTASGAADLAAGQSRLEKLVEDEGQNQQQHVDVSQHEIAVQREVKKPVLFSVKRSEKLGHFMQLKVSGSEWSKGICLDTVGWSGSVSVFDDANKSYQIAANIQLATPSKVCRTLLVILDSKC